MQSPIKTAALILTIGLGLAACGDKSDDKSKEGDTAAPAEAQQAPTDKQEATTAMTDPKAYEAENLAYLETNKTKDGVTVTESGLQYRVLEAGDGAQPTAEDLVTVHYAGRFIDGTEFDSSYKRGEPIEFPVGRVIPGWVEAMQMMHVGDKWELTIPSELAYGPRGAGDVIPPNSTLVFEVELLGVRSMAEARAEAQKQMEAFKAEQAEFLAENAKQEGVHVTDSGLQYRVIEEGTGKSPREDSTVTVHYAGKLTNGAEFDSSYRRGQPAQFPLNGVIRGWTEGLQLMKEGGKYEFFLPYDLGYGERGTGSGSIPPFATLIFTVELISVDS